MVRVKIVVRVGEAFVFLDAASNCGPVQLVRTVWCFYGPVMMVGG